MVLVDTSVWVEHFRSGDERLSSLLAQGSVMGHPMIAGELTCANLKNRVEILELLKGLPAAPEISPDEASLFVELRGLMGLGLGYVDVHLLASAVVSKASLWTLSRNLRIAAETMGIAWQPK